MLISPCTKICMYCCYDPTTQSNGLGPIWYLQPKLGFRRNSFMMLGTCLAGSTHQIHSQQSWGQSISMQTEATTCFTCTNKLITCQYLSQIHISILDFNEKILFQAPVKNRGNSPQSALDDHQNHSQNIINSVRGESGKQENSPVPVFPQLLCTPRTSAWPPPTCPASARAWPSCSPR